MITVYQDSEIESFLQRFQSRRQEIGVEVEAAVREILRDVEKLGDAALYTYAGKFDRVPLEEIGLLVPESQLQAAHKNLDPSLLQALRSARENIARFHSRAVPQSWMSWEADGIILGQRLLPLDRVGIYVPGGRAAYPSSLLMGVVPAQVAGVREIVITTPCDGNGNIHATILAAAWELGIRQVYRVGGAQAVAALAYGTQTIPRVDKIVGPGNIYVATAKKMVYGTTGIDMVAGPSEVVVVADETADPAYIAADLLAQAEHDPLASAILITPSRELARATAGQLNRLAAPLPRKSIIAEALRHYGALLISKDLHEAAALSNRLAPEHLGLHLDDPWRWLPAFVCAGAIFLGHHSPEAVGDYWAGPNHILPTNGSARFASPLRTEDFLRASSLVCYTQEGLTKASPFIQQFAASEGLLAHAQSVTIRVK